jgi:hypothetical protein
MAGTTATRRPPAACVCALSVAQRRRPGMPASQKSAATQCTQAHPQHARATGGAGFARRHHVKHVCRFAAVLLPARVCSRA